MPKMTPESITETRSRKEHNKIHRNQFHDCSQKSDGIDYGNMEDREQTQ